jgi:ABC-2 type transport system permease protein
MIRMTLALIRKELYQVVRDRKMLAMIFIMPIFQLLILGYAVSTDVKYIYTAVYDYDKSELSREYIKSLSAGNYFITGSSPWSVLDADIGFKENQYSAVLIIPPNFSRDLESQKKVKVGLLIDGTNANLASIAMGYASVITSQFNQRVTGMSLPISLRTRLLYNPEAQSLYFTIPGVVALLLTMITAMLTSMAIVREREVGTLEQLMVTPITTPALILGKTIPFALLGFLEISVALFLGITWFHIPFIGSWALLYLLAFIYLFTSLGVGMFISTISSSQQQAMFFTWFFAIFAIMTSGFFTPIGNMPEVLQYLTYLNPLRYFMKIVRAIMMKGAGLDVLYPELIAMIIFGLVLFTFSVLRFSKRVK